MGKPQKTDLRLVARNQEGQFALLLHVTIRGLDLYVGGGVVRTSIHESGVHHMRVDLDRGRTRLPSPTKMKLAEMQGFQRLPGVGAGQTAFNYNLKPDEPGRRTTVVDFNGVTVHGIEAFAIEKGRDDLIQAVLRERKGLRILGYVLSDWTEPMLLAYAYTLKDPTRLPQHHSGLLLRA